MTKEIHQVTWQGIPVTVTYDPDWLKVVAHIELKAGHPLPVTQTGYRSLYIAPEAVAAQGGAVAAVMALLNEAAQHPAWQAGQEQRRQLTLF